MERTVRGAWWSVGTAAMRVQVVDYVLEMRASTGLTRERKASVPSVLSPLRNIRLMLGVFVILEWEFYVEL
jgi:hypothetical protein